MDRKGLSDVLYRNATPGQRNEAAARTEALWYNARINTLLGEGATATAVLKAKTEIEGSLLDLIIRRDER